MPRRIQGGAHPARAPPKIWQVYFFWDNFITILHQFGKKSARFARLFLIISTETRE